MTSFFLVIVPRPKGCSTVPLAPHNGDIGRGRCCRFPPTFSRHEHIRHEAEKGESHREESNNDAPRWFGGFLENLSCCPLVHSLRGVTLAWGQGTQPRMGTTDRGQHRLLLVLSSVFVCRLVGLRRLVEHYTSPLCVCTSHPSVRDQRPVSMRT